MPERASTSWSAATPSASCSPATAASAATTRSAPPRSAAGSAGSPWSARCAARPTRSRPGRPRRCAASTASCCAAWAARASRRWCSGEALGGRLHVLDTTDPDAVLQRAGRRLAVRDRLEVGVDPRAGGDGGVLLRGHGPGRRAVRRHHRPRLEAGAARAEERGFLRTFLNRPDIGGRFSALSLLRTRARRARRASRSRRCSTVPLPYWSASGPGRRPRRQPGRCSSAPLLGDSVAPGPRQADDHRRRRRRTASASGSSS